MSNRKNLGLTPLTLSLSQQVRLGELATRSDRIRKRVRWERERSGTLRVSFRSYTAQRRPFSHGEKDRMRGVALNRYAIRDV